MGKHKQGDAWILQEGEWHQRQPPPLGSPYGKGIQDLDMNLRKGGWNREGKMPASLKEASGSEDESRLPSLEAPEAA